MSTLHSFFNPRASRVPGICITWQDAINMIRKAGDCLVYLDTQVCVSFGFNYTIDRCIDFQDSIHSLVLKFDIEKLCNEIKSKA